MTIFVIRGDRLIEKPERPPTKSTSFPVPFVSRMTTFESPVTGKSISSWRQRDADMQAAGAVDPRDLDRGPFEQRTHSNARRPDEPDAFQWRDRAE
jgi:hypothetical protein